MMQQCLRCKMWVESKDITTGGCPHCNDNAVFPTSIFYKTNKCGVSYPCWGSQTTCKYWMEKLVPSGSVYIAVCKWYQEGQCTCKEAQEEAVSENN